MAEQEELWHPQEVLQNDSASRKLWLVKVRIHAARSNVDGLPTPEAPVSSYFLPPLQVPNFVAKRWKAACEQSMERGEPVGPPLAKLRLVQSTDETGAAKTQYNLQLDGEEGRGLGAHNCQRSV